MEISIRLEQSKDYDEVNNLTREAFWNVNCPGCDEHFLAHLLRKSPIFIKELCFVAETDGRIVGNIMYSKAKIINAGQEFEALTFGPLSVLPEYQKKAIGSKLIMHSFDGARALGYKSVIIYGNPAYYHRFGFRDAGDFGITTKEGANFDAFMAAELVEGGLKGISGSFYEFPGIDFVNGFAEFEKQFPYKEKLVLPGQWR
ncbi:MAG: N-acetyltransferase [Clostridia bacterium]|nr:N-acetyltransferase [Clostridia bacterium]